MRLLQKALLLALCMCALIAASLALPHAAKASTNTYCNIWGPGSSCSSPYNNWRVHTVHNGSGSTGVIYCVSLHPDGSQTGAYGTVQPGAFRDFWAGGYSHIVCQYWGGAGAFAIAIYSYT
jgi:hypothetical protein